MKAGTLLYITLVNQNQDSIHHFSWKGYVFFKKCTWSLYNETLLLLSLGHLHLVWEANVGFQVNFFQASFNMVCIYRSGGKLN